VFVLLLPIVEVPVTLVVPVGYTGFPGFEDGSDIGPFIAFTIGQVDS
jgi:hypothetical protein